MLEFLGIVFLVLVGAIVLFLAFCKFIVWLGPEPAEWRDRSAGKFGGDLE